MNIGDAMNIVEWMKKKQAQMAWRKKGPHQGEQERARRRRQIERGILRPEEWYWNRQTSKGVGK